MTVLTVLLTPRRDGGAIQNAIIGSTCPIAPAVLPFECAFRAAFVSWHAFLSTIAESEFVLEATPRISLAQCYPRDSWWWRAWWPGRPPSRAVRDIPPRSGVRGPSSGRRGVGFCGEGQVLRAAGRSSAPGWPPDGSCQRLTREVVGDQVVAVDDARRVHGSSGGSGGCPHLESFQPLAYEKSSPTSHATPLTPRSATTRARCPLRGVRRVDADSERDVEQHGVPVVPPLSRNEEGPSDVGERVGRASAPERPAHSSTAVPRHFVPSLWASPGGRPGATHSTLEVHRPKPSLATRSSSHLVELDDVLEPIDRPRVPATGVLGGQDVDDSAGAPACEPFLEGALARPPAAVRCRGHEDTRPSWGGCSWVLARSASRFARLLGAWGRRRRGAGGRARVLRRRQGVVLAVDRWVVGPTEPP